MVWVVGPFLCHTQKKSSVENLLKSILFFCVLLREDHLLRLRLKGREWWWWVGMIKLFYDIARTSVHPGVSWIAKTRGRQWVGDHHTIAWPVSVEIWVNCNVESMILFLGTLSDMTLLYSCSRLHRRGVRVCVHACVCVCVCARARACTKRDLPFQPDEPLSARGVE